MSDLDIDQIINDKCRYYAGLVWNDFYTLLSVLDENTDKGELDKCWNDFYFAFWKNGTERPSIIDHLIRIYLEKMSGEDTDFPDRDLSSPPGTIGECREAPGFSETVRNKLKIFLAVIIKEEIDKYYRNIAGKIKDELMDLENTVMTADTSFSFSNCWEEYCFQLQRGKGEYYQACQRSVRQLLRMHLRRLSSKEIRILWLGTAHGIEWRGDGYLPDEGWMIDILEETFVRKLEQEAMNWPLSLC